jgi:hypothetical protein
MTIPEARRHIQAKNPRSKELAESLGAAIHNATKQTADLFIPLRDFLPLFPRSQELFG